MNCKKPVMTPHKLITRSNERMHTKIDWLDSRHSFSFGDHYDPERTGYGPLRVVNDDHVAPDKGFAPHPHSNMEIISIVLEGQLAHKDNLGNERIIQTGEIQYMSAGSGIVHSEFNPSNEKSVHFMQIWIEPNAKDLEPRYADQPIISAIDNVWQLILSPDGKAGSMTIRQDVELHTAKINEGTSLAYTPRTVDQGLWLFVIDGTVETAGEKLSKGDSLAISGVDSLSLHAVASGNTKVMLFELPL